MSDLPVVQLDPVLGLTIEPMRAVLDAVVQRSGTVCADLLEQVEAAVDDHKRDDPDWQPSRTDQSVLRPVPASAVPANPWLADWLTRRERFAEWDQASGAPDALDFSPESLHTIEQLVRDRAGSVDDLRRIKDEEFVQGAVWYLGEVACRHKGAHWIYNPPPASGTSANPFVGRPFVQQDPPSSGDLMPIGELEVAVDCDTKGVLVDRFEEFLD